MVTAAELRGALQHVMGHSNCYCPTCKALSDRYWEPQVGDERSRSSTSRITELEAENKWLREACELVYARVQRIQKQGRIAVPAALWILDRLHAALEPEPLEPQP